MKRLSFAVRAALLVTLLSPLSAIIGCAEGGGDGTAPPPPAAGAPPAAATEPVKDASGKTAIETDSSMAPDSTKQ